MIDTQDLIDFPEFANTGTTNKVKPDNTKYAAGFLPADTLPAQYANWLFNKSSKAIGELNKGVESIEEELNSILTAAGITPSEATNDQVKTAVQQWIATAEANAKNLGNATGVLGTSKGGTGNNGVDTTPTANSTKMVTSAGIKSAIATAESNAKALANATGTLAVTHGGTGATTASDAFTALAAGVAAATGNVTDNTDFLTSNADGYSAADKNIYRRPATKIKNWIQGWISKSDVGLGNVDNTADSGKSVKAATTASCMELNYQLPNASPGLVTKQASSQESVMPDNNWWSLLRVQHGGYPDGYWQDLALPFAAGGRPKVRQNVNGTKSDWKTLAYTDDIRVKSVAGNTPDNTGNISLTSSSVGLGNVTNEAQAPKSHASTATTYGAASSTNYGHAKASSTTPSANGTAYVGGETATFARGDHRHPTQESCATLTTKRYIDGLAFNGSADISNFATCSTDAATQAKSVIIPDTVALGDFHLRDGARIAIYFTKGNTVGNPVATSGNVIPVASCPTLNVNGTGAKPIYVGTEPAGVNFIKAGETHEFIYNGGIWTDVTATVIYENSFNNINYRKSRDGLIKQWQNVVSGTRSPTAIQIPVPFSDTNYCVTVCSTRGSSTGDGWDYVRASRGTTSFGLVTSETSYNWIAEGY